MADTTTANIKITNQEAGGNNNTWGDIADANFERIDDVFGDTTALTTTGSDTTLTDTQELVAIIEVTGTLVSDATLIFSGRGGFWIVKNATGGDFSLTCKVSGQTGVEVAQGTQALVYCNGTDIEEGNPVAPATAEETVASAATANVLGTDSEFVNVSGTTTITSLGTGANRKRFVRASGAFKLTHNDTSLILPGAKDITTAAGDTFIVVSDASSNARIYAYQKATGQAVVSSIPIGLIGFCVRAAAPTNWLFADGETVGNSDSGATARASDSVDTKELFTELWGSHDNTVLPIQDSSGTETVRGSTAAADFAANKRMPLPDIQDRVIAGRGNMSGTSANRLTDQTGGVDGDTLGATGGSETHTLVEDELASLTLTFTGNTLPNHVHAVFARGNASGGVTFDGPNGIGAQSINTSGASAGTPSGTISSVGSDDPHNNVQPIIIENAIIYAGAA